jgi:PleD family two-component response regulator
MEGTVRALSLPHPGVEGCVTISLGVTAGCQTQGLVEAADKALYQAKAAGRGRVSWVEG